jgi:hypothetical protein
MDGIITTQIYEQMYALCSMGVSVAKIGNDYFTFMQFIPSSSGQTSSVDFVTISGICITEFITITRFDSTVLPTVYFQLGNKEAMTLKFNKHIPYFLFSK